MFVFTPLLGAQSASSGVQSILEFDGDIKILVDVGWDHSFDPERLHSLKRHVPSISAILLTHATLDHVGAYAHCCKHVPGFSRIPVYATSPVISLGCTLLQDVYASNPLASSVIPSSSLSTLPISPVPSRAEQNASILLPSPTSGEIAEYFNRINSLKYSQPCQPQSLPLRPPLDGLTITAFPAGHTVGGTIWHLQRGSESVIYAVDWNQARENLLTGAAWLSGGVNAGAEITEQLRQPTALVCSSKGAESLSIEGGWKNRDEVLLRHIRSIISEGGNVLIPCDTNARVLELAFVLERAWTDAANSVLRSASLYMASHTSGATVKYAQSMLEWMDDTMAREFEAKAALRTQNNRRSDNTEGESQPFNFKHVRVLRRKDLMKRALAMPSPKVFLASNSMAESGFARDVLTEFSKDARNGVLLVDKSVARLQASTESFGAQIESLLAPVWPRVLSSEMMQNIDEDVISMRLELSPLDTHDRTMYEAYIAMQHQGSSALRMAADTGLDTTVDDIDDVSSIASSSDDSDSEQQGRLLTSVPALNQPRQRQKQDLTDEELGIDLLLQRRNVHDYDVRDKKGRDQVFPFIAKRSRNDDYGDLIRAEDYMRPEEREDLLSLTTRNSTKPALGSTTKPGNGSTQDPTDRDKVKSRGHDKAHLSTITGPSDVDMAGVNYTSEPDEDEPQLVKEYLDSMESTREEPRKLNLSKESMRFRMKVAFVDYSAVHDKRSLQLLLPLIKPGKLILTGGNPQETATLALECRNLLGSAYTEGDGSSRARVFTPQNGISVDASVDTNAWSSKINEILLTHLKWHTLKNFGIATALGQVEAAQAEELKTEENTNKRQKLEEPNGNYRPATSTEKPASVLTALPDHLAVTASNLIEALQIGDTRLAQLRRLLQSEGHTAEFKGEGTLLIDGNVAVRKNATGQIEVELGGSSTTNPSAMGLDSSFYSVKKKIYDGLAVVTTG